MSFAHVRARPAVVTVSINQRFRGDSTEPYKSRPNPTATREIAPNPSAQAARRTVMHRSRRSRPARLLDRRPGF